MGNRIRLFARVACFVLLVVPVFSYAQLSSNNYQVSVLSTGGVAGVSSSTNFSVAADSSVQLEYNLPESTENSEGSSRRGSRVRAYGESSQPSTTSTASPSIDEGSISEQLETDLRSNEPAEYFTDLGDSSSAEEGSMIAVPSSNELGNTNLVSEDANSQFKEQKNLGKDSWSFIVLIFVLLFFVILLRRRLSNQ